MPTPPLLQEVGERVLALGIFVVGGLILSAVIGATWAAVEDWRRARRWNRDA